MGMILMAKGKYSEAIPVLRKSIEKIQMDNPNDSPHLVPSLHLLGRALWRNGEKAEAQTTLARCARLTIAALKDRTFANRFDANLVTGGMFFKAGCQDELLLYQGEFEAASKGIREALAFEEKEGKAMFDPEQMPAWEILAESEEGLGNWDAAREAYLRAAAEWDKRLSPGHPRSEWSRNRAFALDGKHGSRSFPDSGVNVPTLMVVEQLAEFPRS
jgi:tetratricopeptide (TPR) repeat protein